MPQELIKKNDLLVNIGYHALSMFMSPFYRLSFRDLHNLESLSNGGFLIAPHQSNIDIILEGIALKKGINRGAYYIMKSGLPSVLQYFGGIKITRLKDIKKLERKIGIKEREEMIHKAKEEAKYLYEHLIPYLILNREIVVMHIQGTRQYQRECKIRGRNPYNILSKLLKIQKPIQFIPLDIEYSGKHPFSRLSVTAKTPIKTSGLDELTDHLVKEIKLFV